jgi:hypothetical protein
VAPLFGTYAGTVEDIDDPEQLGRIKARVPMVYGPADGGENYITTHDLPWALPAGLPAGGSAESGAIQWLPVLGDHVYVRFLDGEPEKPVWEWAGQDRKQAREYPYLRRNPGGYGEDGVAPRSALLTRYGHLLDFQEDTVTLRTGKGYKIRFTDSTGKLDIFVPTVDILSQDVTLTCGTASVNCTDLSISAATAKLSANEVNVESTTSEILALISAKLTSPHVELGPDGMAVDPVVRLSDLKLVVESIVKQFAAHFHISASPGSPTSPPTKPMIVLPTGSSVTFTA